VTPKGGNPAQGMSMQYQLEQQGSKWVVVGNNAVGANAHGGGAMPAPGAAMPGAPNPHEGGAAAPGAENPHGGGQMPSPENLPPASKKK